MVVLVLMFFVESILLVTVGTTPGKWILGLGVTDVIHGGRLSWEKAAARTWMVLWDGLGFNIIGYRLYRLWKSYQSCERNETLGWEYNSNLTLRDEKGWRWGGWGAAFVLTIVVTVLSVADVQMPEYGGAVTIAQFSENFNYLADYYEIDYKAHLNEAGEWVEIPRASNTAVIYVGGKVDTPDFVFTEENGYVKSICFRLEITEDEDVFMAPGCQNQMVLTALAFAGGQNGFGTFSKGRERIVGAINAHEFEDFTFSENGFTLECDVEYTGYIGGPGAGVLFADEDAPAHYYSLEFTMTKE